MAAFVKVAEAAVISLSGMVSGGGTRHMPPVSAEQVIARCESGLGAPESRFPGSCEHRRISVDSKVYALSASDSMRELHLCQGERR